MSTLSALLLLFALDSVHFVVQHVCSVQQLSQAVEIKLSLSARQLKFLHSPVCWSVCVCVCVRVCAEGKVQCARFAAGLAQVAERHSVRDFAYLELCCNPVGVFHSWKL